MQGIAAKLIACLVTASLLVVLILGGMEYHAGQQDIDRQLQEALKKVGSRLVLSLRQSIYEFDTATVCDTLRGEFTRPEINAILVWTNEQEQLLCGLKKSQGTLETIQHLPAKVRTVQLCRLEYQENGLTSASAAPGDGVFMNAIFPVIMEAGNRQTAEHIGEIDVCLSRTPLEERLQQHLLRDLGKISLTIFLLLVTLTAVTTRFLVSPLEVLRRRMQDIEGNALGTNTTMQVLSPADAAIPHGFKELQYMGRVFEKTIDTINSRQTALAESERNYREIFNATSDAIILFDANTGSLLDFNDTTLSLSDYNSAEFSRLGIKELSADEPPYTEQEALKRLQQAITVGPQTFEWKARKKHGELLWVEVSLRSSRIGGQGRVLATIRDITSRKQHMEELENYRTQLEYLVKERTEELEKTHERLLQQEKLATVGQLTATVGHELRNPLGTMRSSLYILQKVADTGQSSTARAIERLNRSVRRCDHIVDELLDFTRTKPLELRPVIVDAWVEEVLNEVPLPDNITVHKALGLADFSLKIDPDRLSRALINAIENGYQAMAEEDNQTPDSKTACLSIATSLTGQRVNITVSDTGPGIPDDVMERIFEPLFSTKNAGIGLGMPTMKQIMEQHHGGVEISTRPGKGTDVTLWLPRPDQKDSGPAESA